VSAAARAVTAEQRSAVAAVVAESWVVHAMQRGWHIKFAGDSEARRRVRLWKQECKRRGEPCIIVDEQAMEARIEIWRVGASSPIAFRGHVNEAPDKADELASEFGAWRAWRVDESEPIFEPIEV